MRDVILRTLLSTLLKYLAGPSKDAIVNIVKLMVATDFTGAEKRERALIHLKSLSGPAGEFVNAMASWALNLALEAAVAKLKLETK
jgi:hypothetical protein